MPPGRSGRAGPETPATRRLTDGAEAPPIPPRHSSVTKNKANARGGADPDGEDTHSVKVSIPHSSSNRVLFHRGTGRATTWPWRRPARCKRSAKTLSSQPRMAMGRCAGGVQSMPNSTCNHKAHGHLSTACIRTWSPRELGSNRTGCAGKSKGWWTSSLAGKLTIPPSRPRQELREGLHGHMT